MVISCPEINLLPSLQHRHTAIRKQQNFTLFTLYILYFVHFKTCRTCVYKTVLLHEAVSAKLCVCAHTPSPGPSHLQTETLHHADPLAPRP